MISSVKQARQHSESYIKAGFRQLQCTKVRPAHLHLVVSSVLANDYIRHYSINPYHVRLSVNTCYYTLLFYHG
jgi:hypothetical protein